ncbi:AbrB/MazE/SpoVT family DNA-binding domain-containing protein [Sphingomonas nostoxanthinifaciens]|uniref:AbrB/MazE/SpoVT family DNA-binding domain-containing protein n=1 Tax=Sphingomonas nostoxanthinifaciens TaxID=2872652 RepID=UPI001CC20B13|nr:AbrB/MazE/SpoVT family DNA-binding domain-containing protein [Sphingomonas nostoxanthinifaciens]UAK25259.1 AbrB/MazE/SpoVT family DNA-binding domain-containing protein [Sphingomonas nostoxanthinifaciens]
MAEEYRAKVFKSGNSVALRLPKALGFAEGTEMRIVREEQAGFRIEPLQTQKRKIDLTGIAGSLPDLQPSAAEARVFDDKPRVWDDPDWTGWKAIL